MIFEYMLKEERTEPKERYLIAIASFADRAIKIWKQELITKLSVLLNV